MSERSVAISCRGLTKSYGSVQALRGLELNVRSGEVFGFLGPNGAGKTTTIRCMLDMIRPDGGELRVLGMNPQRESVKVRRASGYLPGELTLDESLTARKTLAFLARLRNTGNIKDKIELLAEKLELRLDGLIKNMSKGNKQKVGVIQAFMHEPRLLVLDEPTSGLDPLMQQVVLGMVEEAKARGATVFFSSHILGEAQQVSDRVAIVRGGRVVESGDTESLMQKNFVRVKVGLRKTLKIDPLETAEGIRVVSNRNGREWELEVTGELDELFHVLADKGVMRFETDQATLEDVFFSHYAEAKE